MLRKTLIATALSGALAFTGSATPAVAAPDGEDVAKILLGLAAVGIIANALQNERERENAAARRRYDPAPPRDHGRRGGRGGHWRELPARCEFAVRTRRGWTEVFGRHCLEREGVRVNRLPDQCEFRIRTDRGRRTVYGSECLEDYGYTVEARRRDRRH